MLKQLVASAALVCGVALLSAHQAKADSINLHSSDKDYNLNSSYDESDKHDYEFDKYNYDSDKHDYDVDKHDRDDDVDRVPEPSSGMLFGVGLVALLLCAGVVRHRDRKSSKTM